MQAFGLTLILIVTTLQLACNKRDCLSTSGQKVKVTRDLDAFKQIEIYNFFNVYLKSDTVNKIEIEAGEKLIPNIVSDVAQDVLTIKDINACGFIKGYASKNLYISMDTLTEVLIHDGINLYTIDTLRYNTLKVKYLSQIGQCDLMLNGYSFQLQVWYASGEYKLKGKTKYAYLDAEELSFIYAEEFESEFCDVYQNSMGDCYIKTDGQLKIRILDSGNIYYSGNPSEIIYEEMSGTGKLIKKD